MEATNSFYKASGNLKLPRRLKKPPVACSYTTVCSPYMATKNQINNTQYSKWISENL
jgi:hypothetical protein